MKVDKIIFNLIPDMIAANGINKRIKNKIIIIFIIFIKVFIFYLINHLTNIPLYFFIFIFKIENMVLL